MAIFYKITHEEANFRPDPGRARSTTRYFPILKKSLAKDLPDRFQTAYDFAIVRWWEWLASSYATASAATCSKQIVEMEAPTSPPQP